LRQRLEAGGDIGADCRGGFGRSGMRSALLLVGSSVERAERVRVMRPRAIETRQQVERLRNGSSRP
jgi:protein-tyrosine phosphatase